MKTRLVVALLLMTVVTFGFVYAQDADALTIAADWTGCITGASFVLNVEAPSAPTNFYTLDGVINAWGHPYPIRGAATFDTGSNLYRVSLYFTSATGETFTLGMTVDPVTMMGSGNCQRMAHGSVGSDCPGTLSGVVITP
jgi:hypothetical protein